MVYVELQLHCVFCCCVSCMNYVFSNLEQLLQAKKQNVCAKRVPCSRASSDAWWRKELLIELTALPLQKGQPTKQAQFDPSICPQHITCSVIGRCLLEEDPIAQRHVAKLKRYRGQVLIFISVLVAFISIMIYFDIEIGVLWCWYILALTYFSIEIDIEISFVSICNDIDVGILWYWYL